MCVNLKFLMTQHKGRSSTIIALNISTLRLPLEAVSYSRYKYIMWSILWSRTLTSMSAPHNCSLRRWGGGGGAVGGGRWGGGRKYWQVSWPTRPWIYKQLTARQETDCSAHLDKQSNQHHVSRTLGSICRAQKRFSCFRKQHASATYFVHTLLTV